MTSSDGSPDPAGAGRPSWVGAPGYVPHPELPPHAPMPGAPPYPAAIDHPPPPVGRGPGRRNSFPVALACSVLWAAVDALLVLAVAGPAALTGRLVGGLLVAASLAALVGWLVAHRRARSFPLVVAVVGAAFWILLAVVGVPAG